MRAKISLSALVLIFFTSTFLTSCENKPVVPLEPVTVEGYPHPANISVALELGWGSGDYEVGYINEEYRDGVEKGVEMISVGPSQFCVDGEESIYVDDKMNYRILKYDKDGGFQGSVDNTEFTGAPYLSILSGGLDCCYLYQYDEDIIFRYRFQNNEIKQIRFSDYGIDWKLHNPTCLYDGKGNAYFSDHAVPNDSIYKYYKIDPTFSSVFEFRETTFPVSVANYVDDDGNFYFLMKKDKASQRSLFMLDTSGNLYTLKELPDNAEGDITNRTMSQDDLMLQTIPDMIQPGNSISYLSKDYEIVEKIKINLELPRFR